MLERPHCRTDSPHYYPLSAALNAVRIRLVSSSPSPTKIEIVRIFVDFDTQPLHWCQATGVFLRHLGVIVPEFHFDTRFPLP